MKKISLRATALAVAALAAGQAWATNGMLMEGYGPVALSMGGAAQAYDNGTAAMMNNVATLQLGENGTRADVALGVLGPNVTAMGQKSGGTSYIMPAVGWTKKNDQFTYGVGIFGQGGMGTEYADSLDPTYAGTGVNRSELGVGRVIFPLSYKVNDQLNVGASLDYSWAGLDMQMTASPDQLWGMMAFGNGITAAQARGAFDQMMSPNLTSSQVSSARISFSNGSDFTGAAKSTGWAGKIGLTFKANDRVTLGASYQLKTRLSDMKTSSAGATFTINPDTNAPMAMPGKLTVTDFQMPSVLALGVAVVPAANLKLVADVKRIGWKSVMSSFNMQFESAGLPAPIKFGMPQNWKDQTVISVGGSYKLNDAVVVRAGYSHSTNPVPDATVHPLFPAIVKDHYTAGVGYNVSKQMSVDAAVSHAPKVTVGAGAAAISHSQTNYQLMLSYRY